MDDNQTNIPTPQDNSAPAADTSVMPESNSASVDAPLDREPDITPAETAPEEAKTIVDMEAEIPAEGTIPVKVVEDKKEELEDNKVSNSASNDASLDEGGPSETPEQPAPGSDNPNARWYVVHTFAGHENRVAATLRQRIDAEHLEHQIFDILVPTQDKIEIRSGKKETVKEKIFPGYILVKMDLGDVSWLAVRTTQGVTSFVGMGNKPTPISEREVSSIVKFTQQGAQPTFKDVFMVDDTIKIIDGPFAEFIGKVDSVDKEKGRVRVLVSIFGRETPVELDFLQVQKL